MERRITEEQTTKAILDWLESRGWQIICFDFPQSGTGLSLHPNIELRTTKNKGALIPDIVAIRKDVVVFFENKDRFVLDDLLKVNYLRTNSDYSNSIKKLLTTFKYRDIFYGIGLAHSNSAENNLNKHLEKIDFAIFYKTDKIIKVHFDPSNLFI
jgi:hypothetical protein